MEQHVEEKILYIPTDKTLESRLKIRLNSEHPEFPAVCQQMWSDFCIFQEIYSKTSTARGWGITEIKMENGDLMARNKHHRHTIFYPAQNDVDLYGQQQAI